MDPTARNSSSSQWPHEAAPSAQRRWTHRRPSTRRQGAPALEWTRTDPRGELSELQEVILLTGNAGVGGDVYEEGDFTEATALRREFSWAPLAHSPQFSHATAPTMRVYGGEFYGCKDSPAGGVDSSAVQIRHGMCRLARYAPCPCFQFDWAPSGLPKPCEVPGNHHGVITASRPRFVGGGHSLPHIRSWWRSATVLPSRMGWGGGVAVRAL